jgi:hypothetical protein
MASSLWDPTRHGILVFRETSTDTGLDGTNFEVGRVVSNSETGYVQLNPVSVKDDVPVLATPALANGTINGNELGAGSVSNVLTGSVTNTLITTACGQPGTSVSDLRLTGYRQIYHPSVMSDITGNLSLVAVGTSKTLDASGSVIGTGDCMIDINSTSNPAWDGTKVTGLGWKLLTKGTFQHFSLGGTQSNLIAESVGIPDSHEPLGSDLFTFESDGSLIGGTVDIGGMSDENIDKVNGAIDTIVQGLGCGFGGGSCLSMPMNWAPLAPGSAPVVMGFPIGGLSPSTGFPVFSSLTGIQTMCGKSPCCIPSVFPISPLAYVPGPACGSPSAGGYLGTWAPTNTFRFYITPTITGAVGIAACFGGTAMVTGRIPPQAVSPLVPGGNCVVAAKPLLGCKDDGSDGTFEDL